MAYELYDNDSGSFWGYFPRAALAPVDDAAVRLGAAAVYQNRGKIKDYVRGQITQSPLAQRTVSGVRWAGSKLRAGAPRVATPLRQWWQGAATSVQGAARNIWSREVPLHEAHEAWRTMFGPSAPRSVRELQTTMRVPRLRIQPGDPRALARAKQVLGPVADWSVKAGKGLYKAGATVLGSGYKGGAFVGRHIGGLNAAIGEAAQALPKLSGGRLHRLAKTAFSRKGAAAGFALQGAQDALVSGWNLLTEHDDNRDALDSAYTNWWSVLTSTGRRLPRGIFRALDSATLGVLGVVPGLGNVGDNDYYDPEIATTKTQENLMATLENSNTTEAAALVREFNNKVLENLKLGLDADGNTLMTTDASGKVTQVSKDEGARLAGVVLGAQARTKAEQELTLHSRNVSNMDVVSLRSALSKIDEDHDRRMSDLERQYQEFDLWAPKSRVIRAGTTADQWATTTTTNLENQWARRRTALTGTQVYRDLVEANRRNALETYLTEVNGTLADEEAVNRFTHFWDSASDSFHEQYSQTQFRADLLAARREALETQSTPVENTIEEE